MDKKNRPIKDRKADATKLIGKRNVADIEEYAAEVMALTDATGRPARYFLDEGCSPEDVIEHFRERARKQMAILEQEDERDNRQRRAEEDSDRRLRARG